MNNIQFPGLGLNFNVDPIAFSIGDFSVHWYGIIIALGFFLALTYATSSCKKMNINSDNLFYVIIIGLCCGVVGARLYYVIFYPGDTYIKNPMEIFNIAGGGLGIYGGIIGGLLGGFFMAKKYKMNILASFDIAATGFLIGQGIGRWGNFVNQEAFGGATTLPWGMQSEQTLKLVDGTVHPCFLYESLLCFIGFLFLHIFTRKFRRYDGQTFLLYIVWYGVSRFFIEGLRTDSLMIPYINIRVSQAVALVTVFTAVIILIKFAKCTKLTGCGNKDIMELNGVVIGSAETTKDDKNLKNIPEQSTIFAGEKYVASSKDLNLGDDDTAEIDNTQGEDANGEDN